MEVKQRPTKRFGIGEWFAQPFHLMTPAERRNAARAVIANELRPCPPRVSCAAVDPAAVPGGKTACTKPGGVCSLREYTRVTVGRAEKVSVSGGYRITCPYRFAQDGAAFRWIGREILGTESPLVVKEVEFLKATGVEESEGKEVGQIDHVLVHPGRHPLDWCALEIQAVYFSGGRMSSEFQALRRETAALPFPASNRHPDYRSSGPKRLMPQLQIKTPALRRWGRKMAVLIDEDFWNSLGRMDDVSDISNCDIAWFVVGVDESPDGMTVLKPRFRRFTTLERAVEGLTGGTPISLRQFEAGIAERVRRLYPDRAAKLGLSR